MKKTFISILFLLAVISTYGQLDTRKYHFGLQVAPNISWIKPDVEEVIYKSDGAKVGVSYGAVFEYFFTPNVAIVTGVNVLHTGGHLKYPFIMATAAAVRDSGVLERNYKLQYLELPLLLKGSTGELLGKFSFFGQFGIGNGFRIKARADDEFLSDNNLTGEKTVTNNRNVKSDVSFFREALIIGIGADYKLGKTAIVYAGLNFSNGFTDALTGESVYNPAIKEKARVNYIDLSVGIVF